MKKLLFFIFLVLFFVRIHGMKEAKEFLRKLQKEEFVFKICVALSIDEHKLVEKIIEKDKSILQENFEGNNLLQEAVAQDAEKSVSGLLKYFDINAHNAQGKTALHLAVENLHENMVAILLKKKADPNSKAKEGNCGLLHYLSLQSLEDQEKKKKRIVQLLLEYGAESTTSI